MTQTPMPDTTLTSAVNELKTHQTQLDMDGVMVGVSRQALDIVLEALARSGLEAGKAEPVAWTDQTELDALKKNGHGLMNDQRTDVWSVPLYTLPTPASDDQVEAVYQAILKAMPPEALSEIGAGELERVAIAALAAMGSTKP